MKRLIATLLFIAVDLAMIFLSLTLAYYLREIITLVGEHTIACETYLTFYPIYLVPIALFAYEGLYNRRYDFWHESRLVLKGIFFSAVLIFAYLAMSKSVENYSRLVIGLTFVGMAFFIPLAKNITKKILYRLGVWQKSAEIYGDDPFLQEEIYGNPYLGYVKPTKGEEPATVFINSSGLDAIRLQAILTEQMHLRREVVFIPLVNDYDLTHSDVYQLANTRTNLIVFQNRLKSTYRIWGKRVSDFLLSVGVFPFIFPLLLIIAYKIKKEEPQGSILFKQKRLGLHGKLFTCYKFRTMYENSDDLLEAYLAEHPEEQEHYAKYHKYKNDPRVTHIGKLLRKTSLDELPQIYNVFRGEMSLIGPRPYLPQERDKLADNAETILMVKPGITGLWQVSGRSDTEFETRMQMDMWYVRNWSLWLDIVILIKTVKTVLKREGAY
jgi:undecaprenyl-phosphate galactose phosphotransferase